jgi:hypothetical protein
METTEGQMKTLGQIACDAYNAEPFGARSSAQDPWEAAAQAVRAQVIEECALECEKKATLASGECAWSIRLLKEKKET